MPSLLGTSRTRLITPQICHKSPPPPPPLPIGVFPATLFGLATWVDDDPLAPADISTTMMLTLLANGHDYSGSSSGETNFIEAELLNTPGTEAWNVILTLHGLRVPPEVFMFATFIVDSTQPFDTHRLFWENPANPFPHDWREARFSS